MNNPNLERGEPLQAMSSSILNHPMPYPILTLLGQAGALLSFEGCRLCIDPYLTDSIAEHQGPRFRRLIPPPMAPSECAPIDWILLTHAHEDHTDLATLWPMLAASPTARIIAPAPCRSLLLASGISRNRLVQAPASWFTLAPGVFARAVPAAHPTLDPGIDGEPSCVGYLLRHPNGTIYHAGDTIPHPKILAEFSSGPGVDWALLPVNERNYFRDADGIIGNMTVREALEFADRIAARRVVPIHWDLFAHNSVDPKEIQLIHRLEARRFEMHLIRAGQPTLLVSSKAE
jgi:L-ascorbate 6-phosphate lactonase